MKLIKKITGYFRMKIAQDNATRASFLYYYLMISGPVMLIYALSCIFTYYPFWISGSPIFLLIGIYLWMSVWRNWKVIWNYISNKKQGLLLLHLNKMTTFSENHKMKLLSWVYPERNSIRNERRLSLTEKAKAEELSKSERKELKRKTVYCPQQIVDGVNKAILVDILIYAHRNIYLLDDELRDLLDLTDEHMFAFNLDAEIKKCLK